MPWEKCRMLATLIDYSPWDKVAIDEKPEKKNAEQKEKAAGVLSTYPATSLRPSAVTIVSPSTNFDPVLE